VNSPGSEAGADCTVFEAGNGEGSGA